MSETFAERLSRFTPDATGLDRDALLFAAGRASVRPNRRWPALAGVLALSQVVSLVCLWPQSPSSPPSEAPVIARKPSRPDPAPMPAAGPNPSELRVLRQRMLEGDLDYSPPRSDELMAPSEPPLHAFGTPPSYLMN